MLGRPLGPGQEGRDRRGDGPRTGSPGGVRPAHRARQRAGRSGQHHRRHRAVRRRRAARCDRRRGRGPPGLPPDRHGDEHRARAGLPGEPAARARAREPLARHRRGPPRGGRRGHRYLSRHAEPVTAQFTFLAGARAGQVETFRKAYIGLGRHPLSDLRFDAERDLDVSSRHAVIVRQDEGFTVRDLGSKNGTFVNGRRISGEVTLEDGDVIAFGQKGPAVEFRVIAADGWSDEASPAARASAERASAPRDQFQAVSAAAPRASGTDSERRPSSAMRIVAEVARLRRTTKALIGLLLLSLGGFGWSQWKAARDTRELAGLQTRADSLSREAQRLLTRFQSELQSVRDALRQSQAEVARLRGELAAASSGGDAHSVTRLRAELDAAEARQRGIAGAAGVDYREISRNNQDAVALLVVKYSDAEVFSGTAFAVDSQGTLVTNKHVLVGEAGDRRPSAIAVKFSGSKQWFQGRLLGVGGTADVGGVEGARPGGPPRGLRVAPGAG